MKIKLLIFSFLLTFLLGTNTSAYSATILSISDQIVQPTNTEQEQIKQDFTISPNPSSSKINLRLKVLNSETVLTVFDVLGKKIFSKEIDQLNTTLDVSRWNDGVYLVRITSDKETQTKRFVKQ